MARPAAEMHLNLHPSALAPVDLQIGGLGQHHAIRGNAILFQDVEPCEAVTVFLLHGAHHVKRVISREAEFLDDLPRVNQAGHSAALVAGGAPVHEPIFNFAFVGIPGPFLRVAHAHRVGVRVHHDDFLAGADAPEQVAHGIGADLIEAHLLHFPADALDHRLFMAALGGNGNEIAQKADHLRLVGLGEGRDAVAITNDCFRCVGHEFERSFAHFADICVPL